MEFDSFSVDAITRRRPLTPIHSWQDHLVQDNNNPGLSTTTSKLIPPRNSNNNNSISSSNNNNNKNTNDSANNDNANNLKRSLNLQDIIFYGVGCSVGAGIYSLVGIGAKLSGPSIALSFLLCGIACCFTSLSYAEFAARVPLAGSAYTFTYVSFGELCGWLVGWNLTLGYAISAAVVARSWAEYLVGFLHGTFPQFFGNNDQLEWLTKLPLTFVHSNHDDNNTDYVTCCPLAMVIIGFCTVILVTGVKESTRFNTAMTILNLTVLGFVLVAGVGTGAVHLDNLQPIFPHGIVGMARGAGLVFFAYLGFDMVACLSEEVQNPKRNMPIGIIGSLLVSMGIYVAVSIVVVGMAPVALLGDDIPIINALLANSCCTHEQQKQQLTAVEDQLQCISYSDCDPILHYVLYGGSRLVSFGAIFGLTTATFACLMGQPRIFYSMAQDGLLFKFYARVHPKTGVPTIGTILTGVFTSLIACFIDLESLANAISLGTLQVFTFVNAGIILLRTSIIPTQQNNDNTTNSNNDDILDGSPSMSSPISMTNSPLMSSSLLYYVGNNDNSKNNNIVPNSPLVREPEAAAMARSLGLIKRSSREIRTELQQSSSSSNVIMAEKTGVLKSVLLVSCFTIAATLASMAFTFQWHYWYLMICLVIIILCAILLFQLPKMSPPDGTFACPMVPFVPLMGILSNSYMMGSMPQSTWTIIAIWLSIGILFYCAYGIHFSELRLLEKQQQKRNNNNNLKHHCGGESAQRIMLQQVNNNGGSDDCDDDDDLAQGVSTSLLGSMKNIIGQKNHGYDSTINKK